MQSQDFVSKTDFPGSLGPLKDKNAPTLESKGPSLKRKLNFGDLVTPRKRRILESYSTGDICQVATVYSDATRKVDAQLDPFALKQTICASGVEELMCMGFCNGAVSPSVTGLTQIQVCVGANNLKAFEAFLWLRLSSVKLSSAHWDKLLRHLSIPTLVELRVDAECAPPTLIVFWPVILLSSFGAIVHHKTLPPFIFPYKLTTHRPITSPPFYNCSNVVFVGSPFNDGLVPNAAGDTLALSAAWIQALPQVKRVTLRGYSATAAGDLVEMMHNFAVGDVELVVNLQKLAQKLGFQLMNTKYKKSVRMIEGPCQDNSYRMFLCKCARCCDIGGDGMPGNPGGKEVPTAMKTVHLLQAANSTSSSEHEASVLHLARQQLEPNASQVDNLAAELFAITLTDNDANPNKVQQDKGKAYHSLDNTARFTVDDTQYIAQVLQAAEKRRHSKAQAALDIVESRMDRARIRIVSATSRVVVQTIRDELAVMTTALRKVKLKVSSIVSCKSQLESSCDDMHRLLRDKEDALPVSSEPLEFDSWAISVVIFGIGRRHGEFLIGVLTLILSLAMEAQNPHSESHCHNILSQIPRSMETTLSHFKLDSQTTTYTHQLKSRPISHEVLQHPDTRGWSLR
ncbi:uncharacterized protein HD556DRAFT_1304141 [Suillus plorans]|uniref:Uncharacterized protein n=1 Tax=Suillus plorans TaxID=116603 RepID=A0A9P7DTW4_9AGAM|nr:uncharacterized protein HD556DRAFT_1304141 [Suillus plorans]KAG1802901.1 hypothetical protein HD556DRAFT_1304141 [Suillus plorans]